jgi:hypothetical protein
MFLNLFSMEFENKEKLSKLKLIFENKIFKYILDKKFLDKY